jgi:acyl carrier protein
MLNRLRPTLRCSIIAVQAQRTYLVELGLDQHAIVERQASKETDNLELWREQTKKNSLVLSTNDEIEGYVLSIVRDYFRTTKKAAVSLDSLFVDHGLDSLDAIEFVIRIEDELGYLIEAENLELFKKPRHFVNFIKQLEAYKTEFNKLPHENTKWQFKMAEAFPGLPGVGH